MPNSVSLESENGTFVSVTPCPDNALPSIALVLSHACWGSDAKPEVLISRLCPADARAIAAGLTASADRVQVKWEEYAEECLAGP